MRTWPAQGGHGRGRGQARPSVTVLAALAPWSWFVVRDRGAALDAVATGLPVVVAGLAVAGLVVAALARRAAPAVFALSVLAVGAVAVVGPWLPRPGPPPVDAMRVVSVNALDGNDSPEEAASDIGAQNGDVVVVVEGVLHVEDGLRRRYPFAGYDRTTEHLVVSRFPIRRLPLPQPLRTGLEDVSRWELRRPEGPVVVYTVHLNHPHVRQVRSIRPKLRRQRDQLRAVLAAVAAEREPTLMVGDLNLSDRTWGYRRLESQLADAMRRDGGGPTYMRIRYRPFLLRIDHIFVPRTWCSERSARFRVTGSDHRGVTAVVGPCR